MSSCNLLYYFVHIDENNAPIPSTMFAKSTASFNTCGQKIVPLTGKTMTAPPGNQQCIPASGLRYWYQVTSVIPSNPGTPQSQIVPNSMIVVKGIPTNTGGRACNYIEYKIFGPIGS